MPPSGPQTPGSEAPGPDLVRRLRAGITRFNRHDYFGAHEAWEDAWRLTQHPPTRAGLQALVQTAVALEHARRGNPRGAAVMIRRARRRLTQADSTTLGLDVARLHAAVAALIPDHWVDAPPRRAQTNSPAADPCPIDWDAVPRLDIAD